MKNLLPIAIVAIGIALVAGPAPAQQGSAPYTVVESGKGYVRLQDAIDAIGNGRGTIRFASRSFAECGVQNGGDITFQAAVPGESVLDGVACEGKAALVLRGRSARIDGMVFANIAVTDFNGAGIRLEKGDLVVSQSWFRDSQQGILSHDDLGSSIVIDKSTFSRLGTCEGPGGCAHSIYIGEYGSLTVTRSRFEAGRGGHYVKSRTPRVEIRNSSFDDSKGRATNYMIDLPNGAVGTIADNWFVQGANKENYSALIVLGARNSGNPSDGLMVTGNNARYAPGAKRSAMFFADWSDARVELSGNSLDPQFEAYKRLK